MSEGKLDDNGEDVWLDAYHDPMANIDAYSECVGLCDIDGFGEYKLVVADSNRKLKVLKDTHWEKSMILVGRPSALEVFYHDRKEPRVPIVAVSAGSSVWMHRHSKPYFKLDLPHIKLVEEELSVWAQFKEDEITSQVLKQGLMKLRDQGVPLSNATIDLLSMEQNFFEDFAEKCKDTYNKQTTGATCMASLPLDNTTDEKPISMLVIGTESREVHMVDPSKLAITKTVAMPSVPIAIKTSGSLNDDHRIVVACRDATLYIIKKGILTGRMIELEAQIVDLVIIRDEILVATMDKCVHCFTFKGKRKFSVYLPDSITNVCLVKLSKMRTFTGYLVSLANGELRLYSGKSLISKLELRIPVTAMAFGPYGREAGAMLLVHNNKSVSIKILRRQAKLEIDEEEQKKKQNKERQIPLDMPRKTKLYVEQTKREQDQSVAMHRKFQRDLCKLRLAAARAYVKIIEHGQGPLSTSGQVTLHLDAQVQGLGPCFKIKLALKNTGKKALYNIPLTVVFDPKLYRVQRPMFKAASLVPSLDYQYDVDVESIDPNGASSPIKIFICNTKSCVPVISAVVNMPISEVLEDD